MPARRSPRAAGCRRPKGADVGDRRVVVPERRGGQHGLAPHVRIDVARAREDRADAAPPRRRARRAAAQMRHAPRGRGRRACRARRVGGARRGTSARATRAARRSGSSSAVAQVRITDACTCVVGRRCHGGPPLSRAAASTSAGSRQRAFVEHQAASAVGDGGGDPLPSTFSCPRARRDAAWSGDAVTTCSCASSARSERPAASASTARRYHPSRLLPQAPPVARRGGRAGPPPGGRRRPASASSTSSLPSARIR